MYYFLISLPIFLWRYLLTMDKKMNKEDQIKLAELIKGQIKEGEGAAVKS
jgi:hypothetical protein